MVKIEIWSDVVCPFCYMGKRRFEKALALFQHRDEVEVEWRSFQLDPTLRVLPTETVYEYLARRKGIAPEASRKMHARLTEDALKLGLSYNFDTAVVANTLDAHRLTHMARKHGNAAEVEERLFAAYFTEGRDIQDHETLAAIGASAGMNAAEVREMLLSNSYTEAARREMSEAEELGATGVPFFVFDRVYAVSGAQSSEVFLEILQKVVEEKASAGDVQVSRP